MLVEKPLADGHVDAEEMVDGGRRTRGLVLMCDHTYCYTPVVQKIADLVADGSLGDIHFVDSVRINLGLVQPDVNVIWDLAPHDLSILDYILPGGLNPVGVAAHGADPLGAGRECVGYLTLPLASGALAHVHVNWLSPTKIRQMVIGGSKRTLVWDDLNPGQRLSIYDRGVDLEHVSASEDPGERTDAVISYRLGRHAGSRPAGTRGPRRDGRGVRRVHPGGAAAAHGRRRRAARHRGPRGGVEEPRLRRGARFPRTADVWRGLCA